MCMCACVWVQVHTCHGTCVEGRGQLLGTSLFSSDSPVSALHLTVGGLGLQMHAPTPNFFLTRVLEIKFKPSAPCFDPLNPLTGPIFDIFKCTVLWPIPMQTVTQSSPLLSAGLHLHLCPLKPQCRPHQHLVPPSHLLAVAVEHSGYLLL